MPVAKLALENGTVFTGTAFGAAGESTGEVVFNTSMTGYQEILTDPSYCGQIVTMTYPQIGNYGVTDEDAESKKVWLSGFVIRELARRSSNFRQQRRLEDYLAQQGILGIAGIDTRSLVLSIRSGGAMRGVLSTVDLDDASLVTKARAIPGMAGQDLARVVMPAEPFEWRETNAATWRFVESSGTGVKRHKVVALDFGMKWNIGRALTEAGCDVTVMPGRTTAEEILERKPDGVFLSNGPGDPEPLDYAISTIRKLLGATPVFGICLGHQLLGQAVGGKTFKLKFGHRGANHPVRDERTGKVEITTQNHGFAVDPDSLPGDVVATHVNLNDRTLEGLASKSVPAFSVQYHPEASAGPHDSAYLFGEFVRMMESRQPLVS